MKRRNWTPAEQNTVIQVYYWMLRQQAEGRKFNKAAAGREVIPKLDNRSKGSYEAKLMNISAVMQAHGLPMVKGYAPLGHSQKSLTDAVLNALPREYRHLLRSAAA